MLNNQRVSKTQLDFVAYLREIQGLADTPRAPSDQSRRWPRVLRCPRPASRRNGHGGVPGAGAGTLSTLEYLGYEQQVYSTS